MFESASKMKLRFETVNGNVTTEDLWDLPLTSAKNASLDTLAKDLNRAIKNSDEQSFVTQPSAVSTVQTLKFEIVKHVIAFKLAAAETKAKRAENKVEKEKILRVIAAKEAANLENEDLEALRQRVAALG